MSELMVTVLTYERLDRKAVAAFNAADDDALSSRERRNAQKRFDRWCAKLTRHVRQCTEAERIAIVAITGHDLNAYLYTGE